MVRLLGLVMLVALAAALTVSGMRGVLSRHVVTRSQRDITGRPAVFAGILLLACAGGVAWVIVSLLRS